MGEGPPAARSDKILVGAAEGTVTTLGMTQVFP
jgi:hypothetical protein